MLKRSLILATAAAATLAVAACSDGYSRPGKAAAGPHASVAASKAEVKPPFSGTGNVAYAKMLWAEMQKRTRPCWRCARRESLVVIAGDDVRLNYADTYFGKPRQMQAAKLFDGLQASGRSRDDGTGCFSFSGCPSP